MVIRVMPKGTIFKKKKKEKLNVSDTNSEIVFGT